MLDRKNNYFFLLIAAILFVVIFLFSKIYLTDKIIVPAQIISSMSESHSIVGVGIKCGEQGLSYNTWAEEPPIYHLFGVVALFLMNSFLFLKILPFVFFTVYILGIKFCYEEFFKERLPSIYCLLFYFIPFIFIHLMRSLPDNLSIALLIWFFYFWLKKNFKWAFLLASLAVTTKLLAIFPIFFIMGHYLLYSNEETFKKRLLTGSLFALTVIPTIVWFYFLYVHKINNPFFEIKFSGLHHLNSNSEVILYLKRKFWSKVFTWNIIRGISIPLTILLLWGIFKKKTSHNSFLLSMFIGHLAYIIFTNSMQVSAPWYSFYFLFVYLLFAINLMLKLDLKWQVIITAIMIVHSISMIDYSTDVKSNLNFENIKHMSSIPCNFHEYYKHTKNILIE